MPKQTNIKRNGFGELGTSMTPIGETIKKIDTFLANSPDIVKGALDSRRFTRNNKTSQTSFQVNHPSDLLLPSWKCILRNGRL